MESGQKIYSTKIVVIIDLYKSVKNGNNWIQKKIGKTYNTGQSALFRWKQTEKILEPKELLNTGLDIGECYVLLNLLDDLMPG